MRKTKRAYTKFNEPNMFSGLLYCADCGNHLTIQRVARNRKMDNFSCATYRKKKKGLCSCHRILESDLETITMIVARYAAQDTWKENLIFEQESFELLQDILTDAGELESRVPYDALVTTAFAKEAAAIR